MSKPKKEQGFTVFDHTDIKVSLDIMVKLSSADTTDTPSCIHTATDWSKDVDHCAAGHNNECCLALNSTSNSVRDPSKA